MIKNALKLIYQWPNGIRYYIALGTIITTAEVYGWTQSVYGASSTGGIRLQEIYAWLSVALLIFTLAIAPLCKLLPRLPGKPILRDARRMLGISAAWFACWHVGISYINQFQSANPLNLPVIYQRAFALGLVALIILLALVATSFDTAFRRLGIWWFRLHRLIYLGVLLIIFHAFMIGVHAVSWPFIVTLTITVGLLFAAQFYLSFGPGREPTILRSIVLCYGLLLTIGVFAFGYTQHLGYGQLQSNSSGGQYGTR